MVIVSLRLSDRVVELLEEIFAGCHREHFKNHGEDYLLHLLEHLAREIKNNKNAELQEVARHVAIGAHNAIAYRRALSDRPPIQAD